MTAASSGAPSRLRWWQRIFVGIVGVLGVLAVVSFALFALVLKPYRAPSESMVPTIQAGDRFVVNRLAGPDVGEVVVFNPPAAAVGQGAKCGAEVSETQLCPKPGETRAAVTFVKRVIAGPGDRLAIRGGRVILDGKPLAEPYARACRGAPGCEFEAEITVPDGHWYMVGDNRGASDDSRFWGPVPEDWITGQVFMKYWPLSELGGI